MVKRLGFLVAGIAVGVVLTELIVVNELREKEKEASSNIKKDGLFAEVQGNTVRLYKVEDGRFCGYTDTKEFESQEKAIDWVVKETNAKLHILS